MKEGERVDEGRLSGKMSLDQRGWGGGKREPLHTYSLNPLQYLIVGNICKSQPCSKIFKRD